MISRRRAFLLSLVFWLLVYLDAAYPLTEQPIVVAFWGALFAGIAAAFGWLADKAVTIGVILYQVTVLIGRHLWDFARAIAGAFKGAFSLLQRFWSNVLRPVVENVWQAFQRVKKFLEDTFGPVIRFLEGIRLEVLKFYEKWFKPIFDTIGVARRVLQILGKLGLDWAKELDAKLAALEDRLIEPIRRAMSVLNQVIDVVNRIMTLDGLIQRITLLGSVVRDIYRIDDIWRNAFSKPLTAEERLAAGRRIERHEPAETAARLTEYFTTGSGPSAPAIDELAASIGLVLESRT